MYKWRGCRTSKYFLLGGSPAFKYSVLYVPRTAYKDQAQKNHYHHEAEWGFADSHADIPPVPAAKKSTAPVQEYCVPSHSRIFIRSPVIPSKFILICLLLSKAKVFTILIKGSFGLFFKIRHLNFTTNGCSFFIHLIGEKQYSVKTQ